VDWIRHQTAGQVENELGRTIVAFGEISYLLSFLTLNSIDVHTGLFPSTHTRIRGIDQILSQTRRTMAATGFEQCDG
jgi:hypothetical protein